MSFEMIILERRGASPLDMAISQESILGLSSPSLSPWASSSTKGLQTAPLHADKTPTYILTSNIFPDLQTKNFPYIINVSLTFQS